jgi:hypothetical protein
MLPLKIRVAQTCSQASESRDKRQYNILPSTFELEDSRLRDQGAALVIRPEIYFQNSLRGACRSLQAQIALWSAYQKADFIVDESITQNADRITKRFEERKNCRRDVYLEFLRARGEPQHHSSTDWRRNLDFKVIRHGKSTWAGNPDTAILPSDMDCGK